MTKFRVFGSATVGRIFLPDGLSYPDVNVINISPIHGRSVAIKVDNYKWILVKGGGWTYKGPQIYLSNKDEELVFGLYSLVSAQRELLVSKKIEEFSNEFPKVLYYKKIFDYDLPKTFDCLKTLRFKNGNLVEPCLLYTQVKCPYRVADLMYLTANEKEKVVESCCKFWNIPTDQYIQKFTEVLAKNVAVLHKNGFINDTLEYSNVTMLGEIVDYEWVTAPNVQLIDGSDGLELTNERREKELIYGAEVCLQLRAFFHKSYNFFDIYKEFVLSYEKVNPEFVSKNQGVQKMLERKKIII